MPRNKIKCTLNVSAYRPAKKIKRNTINDWMALPIV